jgi:hypothetical protein
VIKISRADCVALRLCVRVCDRPGALLVIAHYGNKASQIIAKRKSGNFHPNGQGNWLADNYNNKFTFENNAVNFAFFNEGWKITCPFGFAK